MRDPYNEDLERNPANFQPLTPLTFLERAASVFPKHMAIIHGVKTRPPILRQAFQIITESYRRMNSTEPPRRLSNFS